MQNTLPTPDSDRLILTVNRRLARTLIQQMDQEQLAAGATVWPTPRIMPLATWLEQCWEHLLDQRETDPGRARNHAPTLLTPWQERLLWESIITASPEGERLLRVDEAAKNAQKAWNLLQEWQVTPTEADLYDHEDAQAFYAWSTRFATLCRQRGWLDRASLIAYLLPHLAHHDPAAETGGPVDPSCGASPRTPTRGFAPGSHQGDDPPGPAILPKQILLAGFQPPIPPNLGALWATLTQAGIQIEEWTLSRPAGRAVRVGHPSTEAELVAAAHWSRAILTQTPEQKIGIIIPTLENLLPQVVAIFSRTFYPGTNPTTLDPRSKLFNISLGARLTETPLVRDALLLLGLGKGNLALIQYTRLLHSPFWQGGQTEWSARSLLDSRLRHKGFLQIQTSQLRREAARGDTEAPPCPILAATLATFATFLADSDQKDNRATIEHAEIGPDSASPTATSPLAPARPSVWIERFSRWLTVLGWPGERGLTSGEYQNVVAWREGLALFATLDKMAGRLSLTDALALLERLLAERPFQPEADDAPIQIMGMLEAVGETCTHLWITGLAEDAWPPPLAPNPFLPIALQRHHGMPHAAFAQEAAYHQALFQTFLQSAEEIVCSYPLWNDDQPLRPTPMIAHLPEQRASEPPMEPLPDYHQMLFEAAECATLLDDCGPPYPTQDAPPVSTAVLKAQAVCPFQAFARFRLGATARPEPDIGLDASQRGQIVHGALTQLWQHLGAEQTDIKTVATTDNPLVQMAVQETLEKATRQWPEPLHPFFRQLEDARLTRLLHTFLQLEQGRDVAFTVVGQEMERTLTLGALTVRVRLDRIDRLPDGSLVVLDYKTGQTRTADWFGDRPADPQLPLYLLAWAQSVDERVAALAFCQVRAGECRFNGLADQEGLLPRVEHFQKQAPEMADWQEMIGSWRAVLTNLGEQFIRGEARVDPLPQSCLYCDLTPLCRYPEQGPIPTEEEQLA
ncbi:MAG: PD-(D/E)XK nuclease family protein [Magnetococcales bacterium]|nr:PD-(D/E)XK nuclease family protein [Magnetococcales bacterium]